MNKDTQSQVEQFFSKYPRHTYDKGQILIFAEEEPQHVYYLAKGLVRQYDLSYRGDEIVVNVFRPGTFFPMSWAINRSPNEYFFQASEDIEVYIAEPNEVVAFVKENPAVLFDLLGRVYSGMDGILRRMVHLMGGSAKSRLMYEIIIQCRRFGTKNGDGSYSTAISEHELASRAGLSRETVSREMRKLTSEHYVKVSRGKITINNLEEFETKLGSIV